MKKYILSLFAISVLSIVSLWYTFAADLWWFTIDSFHVDMNINTDGSMDVKETISANFIESRHGIYREIPTKDPAGDYLHIKNITTIWDPVAGLTINNWYYTLKIWSADSYVFWPKTYIVTYTVQNAIKAYASGSSTTSGWWQELYWNVIWPQWETTIANSTFTITLPKDHTFWTWNTFIVRWGVWEQNKNGTTITQINPTTINGGVSVTLAPKQWVTVWLQFPSDYFIAASNYNDLFSSEPSLGFRQSIKARLIKVWEGLFPVLFWVLFIGISLLWSKKRWSITWRKSARKSSKAIAPYYLPPRNIDPTEAFWFWYNAQNPQIFVALLYYRATKWRTRIELIEGKKYIFWMKWEDTFIIHEVQENPTNATAIDKELLQEFFWPRDSVQDKVKLSKDSYTKMTRVLWDLEAHMDLTKKRYERKWNIFTRKFVLTSEWEQLFEEMRWFKEFLQKVERPVIDAELKNNPNFLNAILPRAVLFGVETRLLEICEDMLQQMDWYQSYNGSVLNAYTFASMTSSIKSSVIAPRSSWGGWWGSGFSWGGWSSWGGGWGWWGGSW